MQSHVVPSFSARLMSLLGLVKHGSGLCNNCRTHMSAHVSYYEYGYARNWNGTVHTKRPGKSCVYIARRKALSDLDEVMGPAD